MVDKIKAAAIQLTSTAEMERNVAQARRLVQEAAREGAQVVALPEHFAYLGPEDRPPPSAQSLEGSLVAEFSGLARELQIFLLLGSFPELPASGGRPYNTSFFLGPAGQILAVYRKLHLFDVAIAGGPNYQESLVIQPGQEVVTAPLPGTPWVAGLAICYDLRFPELFRRLAAQGANLLCLPAAFTRATGRDHWEVLLRARAIENQCYLMAPAQYGRHAPGRQSYGRSLIIDPWGLILAQAPDGEGVISAWLDFERLDKIRRELPCLSHRRLP
jgi:predicted amidohydrolase